MSNRVAIGWALLITGWLASVMVSAWWVLDSLPAAGAAWESYLVTVGQLAAMSTEIPEAFKALGVTAAVLLGAAVMWSDSKPRGELRHERQT